MQNAHRGMFALLALAVCGLGGCGDSKTLPVVFMPTAPRECEEVMAFKVDPLPKGKSDATKLSVAMAKEGAARSVEQSKSKVCAEYALRASGTMKDGDRKPAAGEPTVAAASTRSLPKVSPDKPDGASKQERVEPAKEPFGDS